MIIKKGMSIKELSEKYHRDAGTIIGKLKQLNIHKPINNKYSNDDIEFLKIYYPLGDWDSIFKRFPTATKQNIFSLASKYNISADYYNNSKWTEDEIKILKNNYCCGNIKHIEKLIPKHSYIAILSMANKLGIKCREFWSNDEIEIIKSNYSKCTLDEMCLLLPQRNRKTIIEKASELNLRNKVKFQVWEEKYIQQNYLLQTDKEIAEFLHRNWHSILDKRCRMGWLKPHEKSCYQKLFHFFRANNYNWEKRSMEECNYECVITHDKFDDIHHVYGFNLIMNEVIEELQIEIKSDFNDYSLAERDLLLHTFFEIQDKYPLGKCLSHEIHKHFHKIYGYGNNTIEQWEHFVSQM